MDLKLIQNLLDMIAESEVDEVSIEEGDFKIKIKKNAEAETGGYPMPMQYAVPAQQPQPQQPAPPASGAAPDSGGEPDESADGNVITSPIVGTFYEASSPDSDPFVSVGDTVEKGQTVCIVEAMKIMNEIESEYSGTIKKVLVKNAEPVEYDQPLFIIG